MPQADGNNGHIFEFGKFVLDPNERILFADGQPVHLTDKVFDTLHLFIQNNGRLLTKEQMMSSIWEESFVEEGNLAKNISRLRKILRTDDTALIETIPRRGYRFAADVKELNGDTSLLIRRNLRVKITQTEHEVAKESDERPKSLGNSSPVRRSRVVAVVAVALVLVIASGLGFYFLKSDAAVASGEGSALGNEDGFLRLTNDPSDDFWPKWTKDGRIRFYRRGSDKRGKNILINADGTGQTEVQFKGEIYPQFLHWSPDGSKVVFSKPGDDSATYLANADGSNEVALPRIGNTDWSPDGKKIVYQRNAGEPGLSELFIYSIETGKTENITNHPGFDADPNFSPDGSQLVFASSRDGNAEIYIMNSDGTDVRRLTNSPAWDNHPVFSPDGTTIAFNSDRENENSDVLLMNTDGGDMRALMRWKSNESVEPGCWSPDGTQIAFVSDREGNDEVFVANAEIYKPQPMSADDNVALQNASYSPDGKLIVMQAGLPDRTGELRIYDTESKQTRVVTTAESGDIQPVFSPDGSKIAFQKKIGSNTEICLINLDGSDLVNLTQNPARDITPHFSPDGSKILFATNRGGDTGLFQSYVMNADGSDQRRAYLRDGFVFSSTWMPDGIQILLGVDVSNAGDVDIFRTSIDDPSLSERLTFHKKWDAQPEASPDGTKIAFASNADGNWEVYLMNSDGTGRFRLTRNAAFDWSPRWSPDGTKLLLNSNRSGTWAIYTIDLKSI
jgi:Tol biopolymer transport system component/DNA-binding winged helix-turn-helix (wHTH) protein